ncbi:MAG: bifunctional aconitate hydratase 2/2-methylisocitrate dehydratase [Deltaproteobacteria bacterium]|nr:bifunctional aconitate hydratase 2/2-methylisocitrate dehydratase [Deltaproteobacteria bacterium]
MIASYLNQVAEREALGIPPQPLTPDQVQGVCILLQAPPKGKEEFLVDIFKNRIAPGVDPGAQIKAEFLADIIFGKADSPLISKSLAVSILGTMVGGYNIAPLVEALRVDEVASMAVNALSRIFMVYDAFEQILDYSQRFLSARQVLKSWARAEWFTTRPVFPKKLAVRIFKVDGEVNTDDLSPPGSSWSRSDIPLHALDMGKFRFPNGVDAISEIRRKGENVAFVADVLGTGSSRKSAVNSLMWHLGTDIPHVPNRRIGSVVIGGVMAPIFFNTVRDSGGLPLCLDVSQLNHGDRVVIDTVNGTVSDEKGNVLISFELKPATLPDEFRAGGRIPLVMGKALTSNARRALHILEDKTFIPAPHFQPGPEQGYSLAQKLVGKACGLQGVLPGTSCEPNVDVVGSQDATGPMTVEELKGIGCLKFNAPLFLQSFCHTAAYPKAGDLEMQETLPEFVISRGGVSLAPGDGVLHCWINRMLVPDRVGTAGDSHTRFPMGISFPAGSGMVAFSGAVGFMPLEMPESVLIKFTGFPKRGITLRDLVNVIPYMAVKKGLLTVPKKNKKNIFNGRIIEIEGLEELTSEQAFEITNSSAERSAAACCIKLSEMSIRKSLRSNVALLERMVEEGYEDSGALKERISEMKRWLKKPELLSADANADYAETLEIDLDALEEPLVACPNDPDDVRPLSEVAGTPVEDVFIGSCLTNIGHFRAAAEIWRGAQFNPKVRIWLCPPTRLDYLKLKEEGLFPIFANVGARVETAGCSLCMGNQARVPQGSTVFSTSTRNYDDRLGDDSRVFLGSAELAAITAMLGHIPTLQEYMDIYEDNIYPNMEKIWKFLQFNEMLRF